MIEVKLEDGLLFPFFQPPVPWNPSIVLVDLPIARAPVIELAFPNAQPSDELLGGQVGLVCPVPYIIDDRIADVVGNPTSV
jgi:hypothetical protein